MGGGGGVGGGGGGARVPRSSITSSGRRWGHLELRGVASRARLLRNNHNWPFDLRPTYCQRSEYSRSLGHDHCADNDVRGQGEQHQNQMSGGTIAGLYHLRWRLRGGGA